MNAVSVEVNNSLVYRHRVVVVEGNINREDDLHGKQQNAERTKVLEDASSITEHHDVLLDQVADDESSMLIHNTSMLREIDSLVKRLISDRSEIDDRHRLQLAKL